MLLSSATYALWPAPRWWGVLATCNGNYFLHLRPRPSELLPLQLFRSRPTHDPLKAICCRQLLLTPLPHRGCGLPGAHQRSAVPSGPWLLLRARSALRCSIWKRRGWFPAVSVPGRGSRERGTGKGSYGGCGGCRRDVGWKVTGRWEWGEEGVRGHLRALHGGGLEIPEYCLKNQRMHPSTGARIFNRANSGCSTQPCQKVLLWPLK